MKKLFYLFLLFSFINFCCTKKEIVQPVIETVVTPVHLQTTIPPTTGEIKGKILIKHNGIENPISCKDCNYILYAVKVNLSNEETVAIDSISGIINLSQSITDSLDNTIWKYYYTPCGKVTDGSFVYQLPQGQFMLYFEVLHPNYTSYPLNYSKIFVDVRENNIRDLKEVAVDYY